MRLDPLDEGRAADWPAVPLDTTGRIGLPQTTDLAGLGYALDPQTMRHAAPFPVTTRFPGTKEPQRADEHGYLVRRHLYVGPAWYEREVFIPAAWREREIALRLERALWTTEVWIDGQRIGACDSLVAEHRHELGVLTPGPHRLTIRVDNRMIHNISTITHAYGPETQSRWNGLIGALTLEAARPTAVRSLAVHPAPDRLSVRVVVQLARAGNHPTVQPLRIQVLSRPAGRSLADNTVQVPCPTGRSIHEITLPIAERAEPWDEFRPVLYELVATLGAPPAEPDTASVTFGFRHVERQGQELRLNGRPIFLRGTLDCAVYPRTGHPPMTVPEWERVMRVIKEYGFNHVRFHTWCPPRAAFEAADRLGVYLLPETAAWVDDWGTTTVTRPAGIGRDPAVTEFLRAELRRMSEAYGNHPSFLLCAIGNEFGERSTDWDRVNALVEEIQAQDPRRLYTACGARRHLPADQFWFTHHTGHNTRGVGPPHADWDFGRALALSPVPLIAHETGQRPVFPDYDRLLPKFTGPLLPLNLERHRRTLLAHGLADQVPDFVRASARFQLIQYKAEHEAMLRTAGYAGYQLLMLNDFTGQSEALVGILDPFWEPKGIVDAAEVRAWNAPTVLLARFPQYVWTAGESFTAQLEIAHFGPVDLPAGPVHWELADRTGTLSLARGAIDADPIPAGRTVSLGTAEVRLDHRVEPVALLLRVRCAANENAWPIWVYPPGPADPEPPGVRVTRTLDDATLEALASGDRVILLAHGLKSPHTARTGFESVYWSAGWWGNRFSSLGILCDPAHPALRDFPQDGHSDWQWHPLTQGATTFDLTGAPDGLRPIVQPVPDFHYATLLGQVFEGRVGKGSLLVCGYDVSSDLERRPAARQLRRSLYRYAAGESFRPTIELPIDWIRDRCRAGGLAGRGATILRVSSQDTENGHLAEHTLDGDPATFWHTRWQPRSDPHPHELIIDLGREETLHGVALLPRQDQSNGRIALAELFVSRRADEWGEPLARWRGQDTPDRAEIRFSQPVQGRLLKIVVQAEVNAQPFAALAEMSLLDR